TECGHGCRIPRWERSCTPPLARKVRLCGPATCEDVLAVRGSSNGRESGFGPENRGSNPCPPATSAGERLRRGRAHRADPRSRSEDAHALEDPEGPARAVRKADGAVAGARGARGGSRQG